MLLAKPGCFAQCLAVHRMAGAVSIFCDKV
jgi:hypothetical protein